MTMTTVAAVSMAAVLLAAQLKGIRGEYSVYLSVAAGLFIFFYGMQKLEFILTVLEEIQSAIQMNHIYLSTMIKMVGITYIGEFASAICKDSGYNFLGSQIEIFGKLSILAVSGPVVLALLDTVEQFLK